MKILRNVWDKRIRPLIRPLFQRFGFDIRRYTADPATTPAAPVWRLAGFESLLKGRPGLAHPESAFLAYCIQHSSESHAQLLQDLFVRWWLREKREGYFVEFGATDGISLSNTKNLEQHFGWNGILAEPARRWHAALRENRSCAIEAACVRSNSGETLLFNEVAEAELSTLVEFSDKDFHAEARQRGNVYSVNTISLRDLLNKHDAPPHIDYLSIDTEGSELTIL